MAIFNFRCNNPECSKHFERVMKFSELQTDPPSCPECKKTDITKLISSFGSYSIQGNNSASVSPKNRGRGSVQ